MHERCQSVVLASPATLLTSSGSSDGLYRLWSGANIRVSKAPACVIAKKLTEFFAREVYQRRYYAFHQVMYLGKGKYVSVTPSQKEQSNHPERVRVI